MPFNRYDIVIIGAGPGGYVSAIRAAQLGLNVAIVEREHLGGVCLNWGCIPAKTLLRGAEILNLVRDADRFGVKITDAQPDLATMVARSREVAGQLVGGIRGLLRNYRIDFIEGKARIDAHGRVAVRMTNNIDEETVYSTRHIIIATGARARELPGVKSDGYHIWNYRHALMTEELPRRLLIVGAGAIGIEFASFFNTLGSEVTVLETAERLLPSEDSEISHLLEVQVSTCGMRCLTSSTLYKVDSANSELHCRIDRNGELEDLMVDKILIATGITGNVENLGLEIVGVATDRGHIVVDESGATTVPGIWAIGDVAGPPWLAHKASHEGIMVAEQIAGESGHRISPEDIPRCTYSHPQVASIGLTEDQARERGYQLKVGRFPLRANGRALTQGDSEGLVKTLFDNTTGELLGAHLIGPDVTELIHSFSLARTLESTETELMRTVFPHPTLSEAIHESVLHAYGQAIHI